MTKEFTSSLLGCRGNDDGILGEANVVALELAMLAIVRCLCVARPDVAISIPLTMRAFGALLDDNGTEQSCAGTMTDQLASRLAMVIEDWTRPH